MAKPESTGLGSHGTAKPDPYRRSRHKRSDLVTTRRLGEEERVASCQLCAWTAPAGSADEAHRLFVEHVADVEDGRDVEELEGAEPLFAP